MGQFTRRVSRRAAQPLHTFTITEELLPLGWRGARRLRRFTLRQLSGDEVDWTETMILRSVAMVGGRRPTGRSLRQWWRKIGPKGRAGVRLCFQAVHQVDPPTT